MDSQDALRLARILGIILGCLQGVEVEQRLEALERTRGKSPGTQAGAERSLTRSGRSGA